MQRSAFLCCIALHSVAFAVRRSSLHTKDVLHGAQWEGAPERPLSWPFYSAASGFGVAGWWKAFSRSASRALAAATLRSLMGP